MTRAVSEIVSVSACRGSTDKGVLLRFFFKVLEKGRNVSTVPDRILATADSDILSARLSTRGRCVVSVTGHECGEAHLDDSAKQQVLLATDCPMGRLCEIIPNATHACRGRVRRSCIDWGTGKTTEVATLDVDACKGPKRVTYGGERELGEGPRQGDWRKRTRMELARGLPDVPRRFWSSTTLELAGAVWSRAGPDFAGSRAAPSCLPPSVHVGWRPVGLQSVCRATACRRIRSSCLDVLQNW
jgi:hypothetical protein